MQTITFTCETITPIFLSGADGQTPELRPPSIKGALRFWWRAMNGQLSLEELKEKEDEIFGGTENKSKVLIRILEPLPQFELKGKNFTLKKMPTYFRNNRTITTKEGATFVKKTFDISMLDYLTLGIREDNSNVLKRGFIKNNELFYIQFKIDSKYSNTVIDAFFALAQFGGLGSKSHNGFGCFSVVNFEIDKEKKALRNLLFSNLSIGNKNSFFSFSEDSLLVRTVQTETNTWESVLGELGRIYQKARETVEANGITGWHTYTKRILLTHPIIVKKKEVPETILKDGRHSKPYFLHIDKISRNGTYLYEGKIYCFPYLFLKGHEKFSEQNLINYNQAIIDFNQKLQSV